MPDLRFGVDSVTRSKDAARALILRLRIENMISGEQIESIALNIQVQIQPTRRRYSDEEKTTLRVLFGEPEAWRRSLRPLLWTNVSVKTAAFRGATVVELKLTSPASSNDAAMTYSRALQHGDIPLELLFSGTVFYRAGHSLQAAFIAWSKEASCAVPVDVWRECMMPQQFRLVAGEEIEVARDHLPLWQQILEHARTEGGKIKV
jgi:hypothetical protein